MLARRSQPRSAFTLIELIAVLVIVAILAAASVPTLRSMGSSRGATAGKQLLRDLSFARQYAMATGNRTWVAFTLGSHSYAIKAEPAGNPGRANAVTLTDMATGKPYAQTLNTGEFAGVQILSAAFDGSAEVGFDWLGRSLNVSESPLGAQGLVTLTGNQRVTVEAGAGNVNYIAP
jgi:prepilin-type N-terminal cleavage/methylation domain-containing protein